MERQEGYKRRRGAQTNQPSSHSTEHVSQPILGPKHQLNHQLNTTEGPQLTQSEAEESPSRALPNFLTHKIVRYSKMVIVSMS